jgi:hypothetical protein
MEAAPKPKLELGIVLGILVFSVFAYVGRHNEWFGPVLLSAGLSLILMLIVAGTLIWILVRTMEGKPASRRLVFLYVGLAVVLPLVMPLTQKIVVTPEVKAVYDGLQTLKPGSKILASFDYDPPSSPELQPMAESFFG